MTKAKVKAIAYLAWQFKLHIYEFLEEKDVQSDWEPYGNVIVTEQYPSNHDLAFTQELLCNAVMEELVKRKKLFDKKMGMVIIDTKIEELEGMRYFTWILQPYIFIGR